MSEPLASAVIITYNQEKYIAQTIECALAQKVDFDYEIVIGEDCSTDRTREICLRYQEKYPDIIRVVTSDKNVGLLDNWYRSVKAAKGKYIAGCGGDDFWHNPDKIKKQVDFLEENPEYGMVHSNAYVFDENTGDITQYSHRHIDKNEDSCKFIEQILLANSVVAGTVMFEKKYFDNYCDIEEIKKNGIVFEDAPLWLEIAGRSKVHFFSDFFLTYRSLLESISRPNSITKQIEFHQSCYRCMLHYYNKYIQKIEQPQQTLKMIHWHYNIWIFNLAFESGDVDLSRNCYNDIKTLAGASYLTGRDKIRFYLTYFPYSQQLFRLLKKFAFLRKIKSPFGHDPR
jgi:glycosyltransferase involved in cell wall biosynthesis